MPTLNWIGKDAVIRHHQQVPFRLLEPVAELSCGADPAASGNLIVQGDNLHALKALLPRYAGQVKCIYIDPPYNTGNEGWAYNDNVNSAEIRRWLGEVVGKEGETLDRHDRWLCMMYPRLVLLRQFLRDDGAIFVSIDDNEVAALRLLMDEIFGASNFVATAVWQKRYSRENREAIGDAHEYLVGYAAQHETFVRVKRKLPLGPKQLAVYRNPNKDPNGPWRAVSFSAQGFRPNQMYEIRSPTTTRVYRPPEGSCWKVVEPEYKRLLSEGRMYFGKNGDAMPQRIQYQRDIEGIAPWTWWPHDEVGHTDEARKEIQELLDTQTAFETPKPTRLIERILQIAADKDSLILDSFAGSGTTGHAVLRQNAADGGTRRFILVEMDEGIAGKVTAERIRRVAGGYATVTALGGGFQFCRLSSEPLFDATGAIRADVRFAELAEFVWFAETGTGYAGKADSPLLGVHEGRAVYLLYNGILKDRSADGGNVLTATVLATLLPPHNGPKTVYAAACRLGAARLAREAVAFKQTPYALAV